MKNKIIYFTLISISLLIFSCETNTKLGYNILPEDDILNFKIIDTSSVKVYTLFEDSIATDKVNSLLLGEYNDPIFGYSKANFVCEYGIVEYPNFTTDYEIDSAILYLVPDTINLNHYGNFSQTQELTVYELENQLNDTITYYNNLNPIQFTTGRIIGEKSYIPNSKDTLVAIKLSEEFASMFKSLDNSIQNDAFKTVFKGVYITSESTGNDGAIFKYKLNSESLIKVYSHINETEYIFKVSASLNSNIRFNLFEHDYSSTTFYSNIENETIEQDSVAYIQAMGGLRTKIKFPTINELKKLGKIAINRAELIIKTAPNLITYENDFSVNEKMILTGCSNESQYYLLPEYISGTTYRSVAYSDGSYKFDLAGYIRDIIDGNVENNGLFLFAGSASTSIKRTVITSGNHSNKMKLIISYTKL